MPCQILVSNNSGLSRGAIIEIFHESHTFSVNESMKEFINAGNSFEAWSRVFSIVKVTDRTKDELSYLLNEDGNCNKIYGFVEPDRNSDEWKELYLNGEIERPFSVINSFIVSN